MDKAKKRTDEASDSTETGKDSTHAKSTTSTSQRFYFIAAALALTAYTAHVWVNGEGTLLFNLLVTTIIAVLIADVRYTWQYRQDASYDHYKRVVVVNAIAVLSLYAITAFKYDKGTYLFYVPTAVIIDLLLLWLHKKSSLTPRFFLEVLAPVVIGLVLAYVIQASRCEGGTGKYRHTIKIVTGEYEDADIEGKAKVCLQLYGKDTFEESSDVFTCRGRLFGLGSTNILQTSTTFERIHQVKVWIERATNDPNVDWFVDKITCISESSGNKTVFPFHRWVTTKRQTISAADSILPQLDENAQRRHEGILLNRNFFYFMTKAGGIPVMTELKSHSEFFSKDYLNNVITKKGLINAIMENILPYVTPRWRSLKDTSNVYDRTLFKYEEPKSVAKYMEVFEREPEGDFDQTELDKLFANQRLSGTNPVVIQRVRSAYELQEAMRVVPPTQTLDEMLQPNMEGMTIEQSVTKHRLYKVDYSAVLHDLPFETNAIAAPIALFFVNKNQQLMPVAIQLFPTHHRPTKGEDNPIFLPSDDSYTWLLAKMWFNNADASYHQSVSHLGFTHLLMESMYLALHQTVSQSHPLHRLLAPHFLYMLNINNIAWDLLFNKGGWVDTSMSIGVKGAFEIIRRRFEGTDTVTPWRLSVEGNVEKDIKARGVKSLPNYTFRDDALNVYKVIKKYVKNKVESTFPDQIDLRNDYEMQAWAEMLWKKTEDGGCGIKGLPFKDPGAGEGNVYFSTKEEVIDTITSIIYTCSAGHASVNFRQYEEYGYPLNYPALLGGGPPRYKPQDDKQKRTAQDILQALPTQKQTLGTMTMTSILSQRATQPLGDFEIQYQLTPDGNVPDNVLSFQNDLKELSHRIKARNKDSADDAYDVLDPCQIPNAISI